MPIRALAGRGKVDQIGIVVTDIAATIRSFSATVGIGPWEVYDLGPDVLEECVYDGRPTPHVTRLAIASSRPQIELIQPMAGPSVHFDYLEAGGEGIHHVGFYTRDLPGGIAEMEAEGYRTLQAGLRYKSTGRGGYAYFDTADTLGVIVELIEWPDPPIAAIDLGASAASGSAAR